MDALETIDVSKSFGGVHAVRSVSFTVPVGERRALIGPNGAGKTTLFNTIAGELQADSGTIRMFGEDITGSTVQKRAKLGLGRTYQISQLFFQLTVEENLFLAAAANQGMDFRLLSKWRNYEEQRERVLRVAEQVELSAHLESQVAELSHGLQRQLEVGMALALHPRLIMLDEPAAGLSPSERTVLTALIKELPRDVTLMLIEHDMDIVLEIADSITVLHRGAVFAEGTPAEIRASEAVQQVYLGSTYA